jgi:prepilin-type processing-associated H-X9-DG protein
LRITDNGLVPRGNYFFSRGDVGYGTGWWGHEGWGANEGPNNDRTLPPFANNASGDWHYECMSFARTRGLFPIKYAHSLASVSDGSSNTIAIAEGLISDGTRDFKRNIGHSIANSPDNDLARCAKGVMTVGNSYAENIQVVTRSDINQQSYRGIRAFDGKIVYSGFNTVLPPNWPQCMALQDNGSEHGWGFFPPTSSHTGGVNVAFADGSSRFITDSIDTGTGRAEGPRGGASNFGVWGALGSIAGGESVGLP